MKNKLIIIVSIILLLLFPVSCTSVSIDTEEIKKENKVETINVGDYSYIIYVSPNGNDHKMGNTETNAVKTLERAKELARVKSTSVNGDIAIVLREGVYYPSSRLVFDEKDSGVNGKIVWTNYPGENAVISGGRKVSGWNKYKDGIYYADLDISNVRELFVNGTRATIARTPNIGEWAELASWNTSERYVQMYSDVIAGLEENSELGIACSWAMRFFRIKSFNNSNDITTVCFEDEESQMFFGEYDMGRTWPILDNNEMFFAQNSLNYLDDIDEFYYDKTQKRLYYKPEENININELEIIVPELEGLIELKGSTDKLKVKNIVFNGITFEHSGFSMVDQVGFVDLQATHYSVSQTINGLLYDVPIAAIQIENAEKITIENCVIQHTGGAGINCYLSCNDISIYGNYITDIGATGIMIGPDVTSKVGNKNIYHPYEEGDAVNYEVHDILVKNNLLTWIGMEYYGGAGICTVLGYNVRIIHNEIAYTHYIGISTGWGWSANEYVMKNITVAYNDVHHNMLTVEDGGCFYNLNNVPGLQVRYNYFHDITRNKYANNSAPCYAIYLDEGTSNATVTSNYIRNANEWETSNILEKGILFHNVGYNNYTLGNLYENDDGIDKIIEKAGLESEYENLSLKNDSSYGKSAIIGVAMAQPERGYDGQVGIKVSLNKEVTITALGRFAYYNNSRVHTLSIYNEENKIICETEIDMSKGSVDRYGFKYSKLQNEITLEKGVYYILSSETANGDLYLGSTTVVSYDKSLMDLVGFVKLSKGKIIEKDNTTTAYAMGMVNFLYK